MMPRRPAILTQADIERAIRAAKKAGAEAVKLDIPGQATITVLLKAPPVAPEPDDAFSRWEREYEQAKAARNRQRN